MIPETNPSLRDALADADLSTTNGRLSSPALLDRMPKYSANVSLTSLSGTVIGFNSVSSGQWDATNVNRAVAWPGTLGSAGVKGFTASNTDASLWGSRNTSGDAVIEANYHGQATEGVYRFKAQVNRNYAASLGAPGAVALVMANAGYLAGTVSILYSGADWASGWGDQIIDYEFYLPPGYPYLTVALYHKIFGTVGGHSNVADQNVQYSNSFGDARVHK